MTLEKQIAEDYGMVLKEAQSMGCNKINALYNIPLDNMKAIVNALEEVEQYRAIGTPEECREAVEKQKAKKPKKPPVVNRPSIFVKVPVCPNCSTPEHYQPLYGKTKYCSNCGQKLDWSDEE